MRNSEHGKRTLLFIISSDQYSRPEPDSTLGPSRIAVFEDCKATALTTQPPRLNIFLRLKPGCNFRLFSVDRLHVRMRARVN